MTSYERTNWRDQEISNRHRKWGFNCPAVDLDFLMVEYNLGKPVAIVEYKRYTAHEPNLKHPTYRALKDLSDKAELYFFLAFYWPEIWAFKVKPINNIAKDFYNADDYVLLTEKQFVSRLYEIRALKITEDVLNRLNNVMPIIEGSV